MSDKIWLLNYSDDAEHWGATTFFETKEQAIEKGKELLKTLHKTKTSTHELEDTFGHYYDVNVELPTSFVVGKKQDVSHLPSVDSILDEVSEQAYDEVGDIAEDWLHNVDKNAQNELQNDLNILFEKWLVKYNLKPHFYSVVDTSVINIFEDN